MFFLRPETKKDGRPFGLRHLSKTAWMGIEVLNLCRWVLLVHQAQ